MIFCDTSYLVRIYLEDTGWAEVRDLCAADDVAAAAHAEVEIAAALHRAYRESSISAEHFADLLAQYEEDCAEGAYAWQSISADTYLSVRRGFGLVPKDCFLRAADALHLACARDHGFKTVYSNDKNLLAAARHFGVRGRNVIGKK